MPPPRRPSPPPTATSQVERRPGAEATTAAGVALGAVAAALTALSPHLVPVLGPVAVTRPVLAVAMLVAAAVTAVGHLGTDHPEPADPDVARRDRVMGRVFMWLVPLPLLVLGLLLGVELVGTSVALAVLLGIVALVAVSDRPRWPLGPDVSGSMIALLAWTGAGFLAAVAGDDVVVASDRGSCTAVVRETQVLFTGRAVLFVASPSSPVAVHRAEYPLEESFPFRSGDHSLGVGRHDVGIAFDDGRGGVSQEVPC